MSKEEGIVDLRYRPRDVQSRPIQGEVLQTRNLLVRVVKRRRRGDLLGEEEKRVEIVGIIPKTCRFRGTSFVIMKFN